MKTHTDNPGKGDLLRKSEEHRELLEADVRRITQQSEKFLANALIIGGALTAAYLLLRTFSGSPTGGQEFEKRHDEEDVPKTSGRREEPGLLSHLGGILATQAAGFLLSIAREKLVEYLQSQGTKKAES